MRSRLLGTEQDATDDVEGRAAHGSGTPRSVRGQVVEVTRPSPESRPQGSIAPALIRRVSPRTGGKPAAAGTGAGAAHVPAAPPADGNRQSRMLRPREDAAGESDADARKKQRAESAAATGDGEGGAPRPWTRAAAFHDTVVLVVHKHLPCACSECSALEKELKQLKAFCPRTQMLNEKWRSATKSTLPFLRDGSTFVAVHDEAKAADVVSFLALHKEKELGDISLRRFAWVRDSAARNQLLAHVQYTWTPAPPLSPPQQPAAGPVPPAALRVEGKALVPTHPLLELTLIP